MAVTTARLGAGVRGEFPILAHTTYLNSCSQGALSHRVRAAYEEYLDGWDANGAEWAVLGRAGRRGAGCVRPAADGRPGRARSDDFRHAGCERDRLRTRPPGQAEDRDQRVRVPDHRPDRTCAGAARRRGRARRGRPTTARSRWSLSRRRSTSAPPSSAARPSRTAPATATTSPRSPASPTRPARYCLADSYQAIGAVDFDARALGVDFVTGGTVKYLLGSSGLGFLYVRAASSTSGCCRARPAGSPTRTSSRWTSPTTRRPPTRAASTPARPPVPNIYAGIAGMSIIEEAGTAAIEEHIAGLAARLIDGAEELGAQSSPRAARRSPLVCIESTDVGALVARARRGEHRLLGARLEPARLAPPLQRRGGRRPAPRRAAREALAARVIGSSRCCFASSTTRGRGRSRTRSSSSPPARTRARWPAVRASST